MNTRRRLLLLAPSGVLAAGLLGASAWLTWGRDAQQPAAIPIGGPFRLQAAGEREVTDQDFRGRWMLVYFGYTHCPDACPTALQDMATAMDQLGPDASKKVAIVFITVDPQRDTPAVMRDYVSGFDAAITGLSGTPEQIAAAAKEYRVYYAKHPEPDGDYAMDHSSIIYVMDPKGRFVGNFTHQTSPDAIAAKMRTLIS